MKKIIHIAGMHCQHCQKRIEEALNGLAGVKAKVNLKKNTATLSLDDSVTDEQLKTAVSEAGYEVTSIEEYKGLFR